MEEKDKLKYVLRKATEKQGSYDRAMAEHENSRVLLDTARDEARPQVNGGQKVGKETF